MRKKEKNIPVADAQPAAADDQTINEMIERRKLQQGALRKIITSIKRSEPGQSDYTNKAQNTGK
jgi:hypothetical protein